MIIFFSVIIVILLIIIFSIIGNNQKKIKDLGERLLKADKENLELMSENENLSQYKGIADADIKSKEMISKAEQEAKRLLDEGLVAKNNAITEGDNYRKEAQQKGREIKDKSATLLDSATKQAGIIIENANKRAEEIGGSAYEALKNAKLYEETVKAMKNKIEGYGDEYLIPSRSLLDDLSEEFGFTEAGVELKKARERSALMVKNKTAATCEYVEANRKDTAINFVVDAFNGKVDSILSRVKHDNVGKLEREIHDAYNLVNFNGKAFRDARITEEYLNARLDELKWAAIAQQIKLEEQEEQRRLREQLREEEKARREYEKAMKEAAKDEETLHKAMEKAEQKIAEATEEQKAKYEQQLEELRAKLKEAEERSKRALSMAQQTKMGNVYIISNIGSFGEDIYKIGLTRRLEPLDRIKELGDSSVPFEFDVHAFINSDDAPALETKLHNAFVMAQVNKVNHRKEFFRLNIKDIKSLIDKMGLTAKWTLTAEAREYRETLAIDKRIQENPNIRETWIQSQMELEKKEIPILENEEETKLDDTR